MALGRFADIELTLRNTSGAGSTANPDFVAGVSCPAAVNGNLSVTDGQGNTFLVNAFEQVGDALGDDDGPCESNEACVYMPNFGAYQREDGITDAACVFVQNGGPVTGVTMRAFATP